MKYNIKNRSENINNRSEFGHWEIDTVFGKKGENHYLLTIVERKTRFLIIKKLENKSASTVNKAINEIFEEYGKENFKSITSDNGTEFNYLPLLNDIKIYYANPYAPYERGSNENANKLIRRFFKKGHSLKNVDDIKVKKIQNEINSLQRRMFNFETAQTLFNLEILKSKYL